MTLSKNVNEGQAVRYETPSSYVNDEADYTKVKFGDRGIIVLGTSNSIQDEGGTAVLREFPLLASYSAGASPNTASTSFAFAAPTVSKNYGDGRIPKIVASAVNIYTALEVVNCSKATFAMSPVEGPCFHVGVATNLSSAGVANLEQYPRPIEKYVEIAWPSFDADLWQYSHVCNHLILGDPCLLDCSTSTNDVTLPWLNFLQSPRAILPDHLVLQCDIQKGVPSL